MMNKVILIGRFGNDPETRYTGNGDAITNFSLATSETYKDKDGNKQQITEWHRVVCFKRLAEIVADYGRKGSLAYVEGKIKTRSWEDQSGVKKYTTEIMANAVQFLGSKDEETVSHVTKPKPTIAAKPIAEGFDDDIPF